MLRFALTGLLGTVAYAGVFLALRGLGPQTASLLARLIVALPTSWLNVRMTFRSRVPVLHAYTAGLGGLAVGAALSALALHVLTSLDPEPAATVEVPVLVPVQIAAAAARFVLLRSVSLTASAQQPPRTGPGCGSTVVSPGDADRDLPAPAGASR